MMKKVVTILALSMLAHSAAHAEPGDAEKSAAREILFGMKTYHEPDKVLREGNGISFRLYRSGVSGTPDEVGRFNINCETRDFIRTVNDQATQPAKVLAGEELYPMGKKFCEWDQKGFLQKVIDY